ncbi:tyrosine-tRNA ligase [Coprinopsis cinerea okayama7|uniref:Tyrosine--tRNA ligase n=1 Tax=Coprinopsis cinerea (strain Okayama-7 / 130 / ATCC MYA-4618 / FGSC 9003) TaxID=240176 RepID=A8N6Y4_COPC7|nr:tyrosine-tRNA ligase [Coprinopsis cinerea okayama7\|eukprot:XP_001830590.1 tyrosine-tRNA ligase [Coprinopsis cinerea okayama7\
MLWHVWSLSRTPKSRLAPVLRRHARLNHSSAVLDEVTARGFIQDVTRRADLAKALEAKPQGLYTGIDPTAPSLHIGHLIPLLCLAHFHLHGHKIIPLIGSATGRIGDPSGRSTERKLQQTEQLNANIAGLTRSVTNFFERAFVHASRRLGLQRDAQPEVKVVSNHVWHEKFSMLDFLQVVGIHARINTMMNRESVRARLSSQQGISFTEFTYQLLQAYDFHYLNQNHGCTIQIGGSDQWGNIVAGIELIGKLSPSSTAQGTGKEATPPTTSPDAFGITTPLLTTPSGEKFGKSAGNAVWLDENLTSVFDFYQYFFKSPDSVLPLYLNLFTFLPRPKIAEIVETHNARPELRLGQKTLAAEVTEMVHGASALERAQTLTSLLFPTSISASASPDGSAQSDYSGLTTEQITSAFDSSDPRLVYIPEAELVESTPVVKLASRCGLVASNSAGRSLVASRGLYLNNSPVPDIKTTISKNQLIDGRVAILRAGKDKLSVLVAQ